MQQPVLLVRHGESTWNSLGLTQGQTAHPPLTVRGREQMARTARALAARFGPAGAVPALVTSDLVRAWESAHLVGAALGATAVVDERWRERHFGPWQGTAYAPVADLLARHPGGPAGAEEESVVRARAAAALADLPRDRPTVVITHGEVIRVLLRARTVVANGAWVEVDAVR